VVNSSKPSTDQGLRTVHLEDDRGKELDPVGDELSMLAAVILGMRRGCSRRVRPTRLKSGST
jgi:hypothetical protein